MFKRISIFLIAGIIGFIFANCSRKGNREINIMQKKIAQFVPTEIKYNKNLLDHNQKIVVNKLYQASKIINNIFLEQVFSKNLAIKDSLKAGKTELDKLYLKYFNIMFGPFDRLDSNKAFYGTYKKTLGANFYPSDMTREKFENWIKNHPKDKDSFLSPVTMIREQQGKLIAIPYSKYFEPQLIKVSNLLKEAASYAENPSFKKYLLARATAFLSNDYYQSDLDWMDLKNNRIDVIIGPYEVYEDALFNYKASFESFLTIVDPVESKKLKIFAGYLKDMEANFPLPKKYKDLKHGNQSPIEVVQEIYCAGDAKAGVQTLAFNLPNDERVRQLKGSKKVLLKNIHEAKFDKLLLPIAKIVLDSSQLKYVTFEGFFNHTLMHEISHGIGPGIITVNGKKTQVNIQLKETYSTIEECKADVLGMFNNILMIKKGVFPKSYERQIWTTFLAGIFRSVRFGINEAHGGGNAIIYNYMLQNGAYRFNKTTQRVKVNYDKAYAVLKSLAHKILMIQATGNYNGAKELIKKYAVQSPSMKLLVKKLTDLPVDIKPVFEIDQENRN